MAAPNSVRREAWQRLLGGMFFRVLILVLILYTVYHCAIALTPRMTTAVVREAEETVVTEGTAAIFRDEAIVRTTGQGWLISYPLESGAKVSATSTLATLYTTLLDDDTLADTQQRLQLLDHAIIACERAERLYAYTTSPAQVHTDICDHLLTLTRAAARGERDRITDRSNAELLVLLYRYALLTDQDSDLTSPLQSLRSERSMLLSTVARSSRAITLSDVVTNLSSTESGLSTFSGYFYHADQVDGYEDLFSRTALSTMNIVDYDALMALTPADPSIGGTLLGKTVSSYQWSMTLPVPFDLADQLTIGRTYSVIFPDEGSEEISMTLDRIIRSVGDGRAVLVLSADTTPEQFQYIRFQPARLVTERLSGYRIPETALQREDNGDVYVYILKGGCVRRRDISILYEGQGYVLVAIPGADDQNGLSLNDVVITSGKNLYDGKYID